MSPFLFICSAAKKKKIELAEEVKLLKSPQALF